MSDGTEEFASPVCRPISQGFCALSPMSTGGHGKRKLIGSKYFLRYGKDDTIDGRGPVALAPRFEQMSPAKSDLGDGPFDENGYFGSSSNDEDDISKEHPNDAVLRRRVDDFKRKVSARTKRHTEKDLQGSGVIGGELFQDCDENGRDATTRATISAILGKGNNDNIYETVYLSSDSESGGLAESKESDEDNIFEELSPMVSELEGRMPAQQQSKEKHVLAKLSDEDIRKTSRKYCCKGHCLLTLGTTGIFEARETYFRKNSQDRSSSLQWSLQQSGDESGGTRITYLVRSSKVCRTAFKEVFCVGNNRLAWIIKLGSRDVAQRDGHSRRKEGPRI